MRSAWSSRCAASRSSMDAAVTTRASSRPLTSTTMCPLRPFVLFAPSHPRLGRGTVSAMGTASRVDDRSGRVPVPSCWCVSGLAAFVVHALPRASAHPTREDRMKGHRQRELRQELPQRDTTPNQVKMASRIIRWQCFSGLPPRSAVLPGVDSNGSRIAHWVSGVGADDTPRSNAHATDEAGTTGTA